MSRSFRRVPPEPRSDVLTRPRLLHALAGRWDHRVTSLIGGPGLGKTTLLAQAVAENRGAPRGEDVWVGLEPNDADGERLARVVAAALADDDRRSETAVVEGDIAPPPSAVADALWHRSPTEACLLLDDVHLLPPGSSGAAWLAELVSLLPANGHVVLAGRGDPAVPLSRLGTQGGVLWLREDDLRFDADELAAYAHQRGVDPARLDGTGGWPAMAELAATVDTTATLPPPASDPGPEGRGTGDVGGPEGYVWAEVLEPLGAERRRVLAVLSDLGGADDRLASAAVGTPTRLEEALRGVPLVARDAAGWHVPHQLWRDAPGLDLPPDERVAARRRAAGDLVARGRFDDAFTLLGDAGLWDAVPDVLRPACLAAESLEANQLGRWLAVSPDEVRASTAGQLAKGLHLAYTAPYDAIGPLRHAADLYKATGDVDAELSAIGQIGRLAWWWQDADLIRELSLRVFELDQSGHPKAGALAAFGWALVADMGGDDDAVLGYLSRIEAGVLDPGWEILARWYEGLIRLYLGQPAATRIIVDSLATSDPAMGYVVETLELMALWATGHVDAVLDRTPAVIEAGRASGVTYSLSLGMTTASLAYSHTGDAAEARRCLAEGLAAAPPVVAGDLSVHASLATASVLLAEGDEPAARATLQKAVDVYGVDRGTDRRWWRQDLTLSYVLVPDARVQWDERELRGHLATARGLAAAVVTLRETGDPAHLRGLDVTNVGVARAALHHRFAAELAVGLAALGRPEGRQLLEVLGAPGRMVVRDLARGGSLAVADGLDLPARSGLEDPAVTDGLDLSARPDPEDSGDAKALAPKYQGRDPGEAPGERDAVVPDETAARPGAAGARRRVRDSTMALAAQALLAAVPAPPRRTTYVGVLGPLELRRDGRRGELVAEADLRRRRLRELLVFLVGHRRTTRAAITATLWPDLDERAAANNLGVTLDHLLRLLEPWRTRGEPSYLVRLEGNGVELVTGEHLRVDVDEFDAHVAAAARAETDGAPSLALGHHLAAVELYRDDLYAEVESADWFGREREHCRSRFVGSAVRAGELLLGRGDVDDAEAVAQRALDVAPQAEAACAVLVGAALARGDRTAARGLLDRSVAVLAEIGAPPSSATEHLRRRLAGPDD